jgi:CheY-like chemotaxis protein
VRLSLAERLGVADYLVKPIGRERLTRVLRELGSAARQFLVVDDDRDAARLLARMIRSVSRKYVVQVAFGGAEALRNLEAERPDAVFVDLIMPDVDGYTLIETIRNDPRFGTTPIVAVSAQALSIDPLASDGVTLVQPGGMPVGNLIDSVRYALRRLSAGTDDGTVTPQPAAASLPVGTAAGVLRVDVAS